MAVSKINLTSINNNIVQNDEILEKRSISSLTLFKAYIIKKLLMLNTRFGKTVSATLFDASVNTTFKSFLPKRVTDQLTEDIINEINVSNGKYTLTYTGQSLPIYAGAKTRSLIKFDIME